MVNRIVLIGRLTRDPELKYTTSGVPVATFGLAVNRRTKNAQGEREVDFFNVVAWRQTAEFVSQYAAKGRMTAVDGRVQIRNYVGQDGMKRTATEVVADNVELLDSGRDGAGGAAPGGSAGADTSAAPSGDDDFADPFSET
jgi:single-strand DNA-binding protein